MNSLMLNTKLKILVGILIFFSFFVGLIGLQSSTKITTNFSKISDMNLPDITSLLEGLSHMRSGRIYLLELALPNQSEEVIQDMRARVKKAIDEYDQEDKAFTKVYPEGEELPLYTAVKEQMDLLKLDFQKALELQAQSHGKEGPAMDSMRHVINVDIMDHGKHFRENLNKLIKFHKDETKENVEIAHRAGKQGSILIITALLFSTIVGFLVSYFILRNINADQEKFTKTLVEASRSYSMLQFSPNPTMMCDVDGKLIYINQASADVFAKLQTYLPVSVDKIVGNSIDIFHKNAALQKRIISDPKNLPHKAIISIGPEKADLLISAARDDAGKYIGAAVTWSIVTEKVALVNNLSRASDSLTNAASSVLSVSSNLSASAEQTSAQANTASVAAEEVNSGVQTVANNMEQMVSAIREITKTTNEAASMTGEAMRITLSTNDIINKLGESSMDIGNVIKVISSIAQQTNLLALNATIEAARAGEAGKGFAVVANEVKELANQTAKATSEITKKIEAIQSDSQSAVAAIGEITIAIEKVNGYNGNIAAAVEEQSATTNEVTRIVAESAIGVQQINQNISQVSTAAASTGKDAGDAQKVAKDIGEISQQLKSYMEQLKV